MPTTPSSPLPAPRSCPGRPRKLDDTKRSIICLLVSLGGDLRRAARCVGCSYPTLHRETVRHPKFREQLRQATRSSSRLNALRRTNSGLHRAMSTFEQKMKTDLHELHDKPALLAAIVQGLRNSLGAADCQDSPSTASGARRPDVPEDTCHADMNYEMSTARESFAAW